MQNELIKLTKVHRTQWLLYPAAN